RPPRDGADRRRRGGARAHLQRRRRTPARQDGRGRHGAHQPHELQELPAGTVIGPTPLLDFFKRGEVERDVRMEAAQGTLAPRAHEQLAILVLLLEDPDAEIRQTADDTLSRIPEAALKAFLARADVPIGLREFFADRGIFPDEMPQIQIEVDEPLLDAAAEGDAGDASIFGDESDDRETAQQRLQKMSFTERLRAAVKGTREMRSILIRDT